MSKLGFPHDGRMTKKEDVMPVIDALIVAAIVAAFVIFAGVLAWVERQTRNLPALRSAGNPAGASAPRR
jgi:multisubunit Na+/H+ antiporter MnhC subunit